MSETERPILAVTMGDASGIGPEVIAKALVDERVKVRARPVVVGDAATMAAATEAACVDARVRALSDLSQARFEEGTLEVLDLHNIDLTSLPRGRVNAMAGAAAFAYIQKAVELAPVAANYVLLAQAHARSGDHQQALTAIERAIELTR